ncbi:hypothetical protein [Clostridium cellulovorans]|uniref:Uncharacterized protein n=1 Tax=Clostridium cellulovorans (strain ATCC 35296 / DSM 3052 / OCM 3 / 743B) TaxID=573061 RepID=D9SX15_CLOC7|nr:hypothetical protein [Clostridium cellulovorans]ADL51376.1 hypothetical protein Clocel_1630 [Clostridium cellulovorans 743B]
MKKRYFKGMIRLIIVSIAVTACVLGVTLILKGYDIKINDNNLYWSIQYKGLEGARDFVSDNQGNFYVAFKDKILLISNKGDTKYIVKSKKYDISTLSWSHDNVFFISQKFLYKIDVKNKKITELMKDLPVSYAHKPIMRLYNDKLYIAIGSSTNSGVAEKGEKQDILPYTITSKGKIFGEAKTGAFMSYGENVEEGSKIKGKGIGNASVLIYDLKKNSYNTMAWGIRSVEGMEFNSMGNLIAAVSGMENKGLRPIKGDNDYIYIIRDGSWYGWPDYSGGDPVESPRFLGIDDTRVAFVMDNHPTTNPPAPMYIHKYLSSIKMLTVDKDGYLGKKDFIYFFDSTAKKIYTLNKKGAVTEFAKLGIASDIASMKFIDEKLYLLDRKNGNVISIGTEDNKVIIKNRKAFILLATIFISVLILLKVLYENLKNKHNK